MTEIATVDWFGRWGTSVFSENTAIFLIHTCRPQVSFLRFIIVKSDLLKKGIMTESSKFRQYYRPNKIFVSFPEMLLTLLSWGLLYSYFWGSISEYFSSIFRVF